MLGQLRRERERWTTDEVVVVGGVSIRVLLAPRWRTVKEHACESHNLTERDSRRVKKRRQGGEEEMRRKNLLSPPLPVNSHSLPEGPHGSIASTLAQS
jgi:hypothetical protein